MSTQTIYTCSKCGAQSPKWQGRCLECGSWGTLEEDIINKSKNSLQKINIQPGQTIDFDKIEMKNFSRLRSQTEELDRVLGGGLVPGSLILIGGEPGIGKSTLVLQIASQIAQQNKNQVLYVSGEESAQQIKTRIDRLKLPSQNLQFLGETDIETICATIEKNQPSLAIIDSIQTIYFADIPSGAGSINQVRACTVKLLETAKKNHIPIFIIGHVTKEGEVAGPKTLEHLVDTVLYLEGDPLHHFRILRSVKNRFGTTNEVGIFDMQNQGLVEVKNPSQIFIQSNQEKLPGSVISVIMEGSRPFLIEIQALCSRTNFGYPQRKATGFDYNRLQLLIAVLQKRCQLSLANQDVYLNIAGGIKIQETGVDLAVCLAIVSAFKNKSLPADSIALGEVGLGGEIRTISYVDRRLQEAKKLGFKKFILSAEQKIEKSSNEIIQIKTLSQAIEKII
ncbi:MAG: DNA repair protein RadA [Patescibacteria group bacterium]|nr:DNA repair protein RadA [Patescibacteria group bacterium]